MKELKIKGLKKEKKKINPKNKTLNKETINRINKTKTRNKNEQRKINSRPDAWNKNKHVILWNKAEPFW